MTSSLKILAVVLLIFLASCSTPYKTTDGKISLLNTANKNSFSFSISEEFGKANFTSKKDKKNPPLTKAESRLLTHLLKEKSYCTHESRTPKFIITSTQEKVYDATYAHLIEKSYNARSITPKTYFGQCKTKMDTANNIK